MIDHRSADSRDISRAELRRISDRRKREMGIREPREPQLLGDILAEWWARFEQQYKQPVEVR